MATSLGFLIDADAQRYLDLPSGTAEPDAPADLIAELLRPAANERLPGLVLVGWSRHAAALIAADPWLRTRRIVWVVEPGHLGALHAATATWKGAPILAAPCADARRVPLLLQRCPVAWSIAVIQPGWIGYDEVLNAARYRYWRYLASPQRRFTSLGNMLGRCSALSATIPLARWRGAYHGRTAICVAAGPSLDRRLDQLRSLQDHCVVIAVDVIATRLLALGLRLDFVINVDADDSLQPLLGPCSDPETVLAMPFDGHMALDGKFAQRSYFTSDPLGRLALGAEATFHHGTTVGVASVGFAAYLGCAEALLLGHDLSYGHASYYSSVVAGAEATDANERTAVEIIATTVTGNHGGPVTTNKLFEMAVQDLGMLLELHPGLLALNPNIGDRIGARIPHTHPLPADWQPRGAGVLPRPGAFVPATVAAENRPDVGPALRADIVALIAHWRAGLDRAADPVALQLAAVRAHPLALPYLEIFTEPAVCQQVRLSARPPSVSATGHAEAIRAHLAACVTRAEEVLIGLLAEPAIMPTVRALGDDEGQITARFFGVDAPVRPHPELSTSDLVLLGQQISVYRLLLSLDSSLGLPTPLTARDGLLIGLSLQMPCPLRFAQETVCLCVLEEDAAHQPVLNWAIACAVVPGGWYAEADDPGQTPSLRATAAIGRLRRGSTVGTADVALAIAWPPCHIHLVRVLIGGGAIALTTLAALIEAGSIALDDQAAALVMLHHPDLQTATRLAGSAGLHLGEATQIALAHRLAQRGDHGQALVQARAIRRLSRFHDQAQALICESALAVGDVDEAQRAAAAISDGALSARWRYRGDRQRGALAAAVATLIAWPGVAPSDLLADALSGAWKARDGAVVHALAALLAGADSIAARAADPGLVPLADAVAKLALRLPDAPRPS